MPERPEINGANHSLVYQIYERVLPEQGRDVCFIFFAAPKTRVALKSSCVLSSDICSRSRRLIIPATFEIFVEMRHRRAYGFPDVRFVSLCDIRFASWNLTRGRKCVDGQLQGKYKINERHLRNKHILNIA